MGNFTFLLVQIFKMYSKYILHMCQGEGGIELPKLSVWQSEHKIYLSGVSFACENEVVFIPSEKQVRKKNQLQ